jgi:diguanylate cyclase (GGDEF)-like protein
MATERRTPVVAASDTSEPPAAGTACLVSIYGPSLGRRWSLEREETVIGRDAGCDVSLPIDTVSRRHCVVRVRGGSVLLEDQGSTNGTAIGDDAVPPREEAALRSGDRIRVGSAILKFLCGGDVESLYREEIYRTMIADGLTGAHSRRYLNEFLEREIARSRRHARPLSLVLLDVDHFKELNDRSGQMTGDDVLQEIASLVRSQVRREDCFARVGGDAFAIALTETDLPAARLFAERLRGTIEVNDFTADGETLAVTVSAGVAAAGPTSERADLFAAAEARLNDAKSAGRNRSAG